MTEFDLEPLVASDDEAIMLVNLLNDNCSTPLQIRSRRKGWLTTAKAVAIGAILLSSADGAEIFVADTVPAGPVGDQIKEVPAVSAIMLAPNGDVVVAGHLHEYASLARGSGAFFARMDSHHNIVWQHLIPFNSAYDEPKAIFGANDGGFWAVRSAYQTDKLADPKKDYLEYQRSRGSAHYTELIYMTAEGDITRRLPLTTAGESRTPMCGLQVPDGIVLVGTSNVEDRSLDALWIAKVRDDGTPLWQTTISEDSGKALSYRGWPLTPPCYGLRVLSTGNVVLAATVGLYTKTKVNGKLAVDPDEISATANPENVILELDAQGREIHRARSPDSNYPFLLSMNNEVTLIETYRPHLADAVLKLPPALAVALAKPAIAADSGARITVFDKDLKIKSSVKIRSENYSDKIVAAYQVPSGGYYILSCAKGRQPLTFIKEDGNVSFSIDMGSTGSCFQAALGNAANANEVTFYTAATEKVSTLGRNISP